MFEYPDETLSTFLHMEGPAMGETHHCKTESKQVVVGGGGGEGFIVFDKKLLLDINTCWILD